MNQGSFDKNCELLLIHLENLNNQASKKRCMATTGYLAKAIGKSERQVYRYLKVLEKSGLISRDTTKLKRDTKTNKMYKLRDIKVASTVEKHPKRYDVLALTFNKDLHGRTRNRMTRELIAKGFETNNISKARNAIMSTSVVKVLENKAPVTFQIQMPDTRHGDKIDFVCELVGLNIDGNMSYITEMVASGIDLTVDNYKVFAKKRDEQKREKTFAEFFEKEDVANVIKFRESKMEFVQKTKEELDEILAESDELARQKAFRLKREGYAGDIVKSRSLSIPSQIIDVGSNVQSLVNLAIKNYREIEAETEEYDPPDQATKVEKMSIMADNSEYVNGQYIITIFLGGQLPHKLPLFDYVPWDSKSEYFKLYEEQMVKKGKK